MPNLGLGLGLQKPSNMFNLLPRNVNGNVLSLVASKANKGQAPITASTKVWSDMSKVRNTIYYSNFVNNGNFVNTTDWTGTGCVLTAVNNTLTGVGNGTQAYLNAFQVTSQTRDGKTVYAKMRARVLEAGAIDLSIYLAGNKFVIASNPVAGQWYSYTAVYKDVVKDGTAYIVNARANYANAVTANMKTMEVQEVMIVNLSSMGAQTLSLEQCNELFNFTSLGSSATLTRYNPQDWEQWTKVNATVISDSIELINPVSVGNSSIIIPTNGKASTKYGMLYNIVSTSLTNNFLGLSSAGIITGTLGNVTTPLTVGYKKFISTSPSTITANQLYIYIDGGTGINNESIKIKDIRVFELPTGSQIETDFTNLTADQLNVLYPMGYDEAISNPIANDCTLNNLGGTVTSGFKKIPIVNGQGDNIAYSNIVVNNNFVNTSNWTQAGLAGFSVSANEAIMLANSVDGSITQVITTTVGHRYYTKTKLKALSNLVHVRFGNTIKYHTGSGLYESLSLIHTATSTSTTLYLTDSRGSLWSTFFAKEVININLSANTYVQALESSLGRVLTADECDRLFAFTASSSNVVVDTQYALTLDGTDDYGAFLNIPSLNITTNEFALCCTFMVAVGATGGIFFAKSSSSSITQYQYNYDATNKRISLNLNGIAGVHVTPNNSISENVWYNIIFYRNSSGSITPVLNKISISPLTYATALTPQPNVSLGARSGNAGGTSQEVFFKGDIASLSIYQVPQLNINQIIEAEMNISKPYTGVS